MQDFENVTYFQSIKIHDALYCYFVDFFEDEIFWCIIFYMERFGHEGEIAIMIVMKRIDAACFLITWNIFKYTKVPMIVLIHHLRLHVENSKYVVSDQFWFWNFGF